MGWKIRSHFPRRLIGYGQEYDHDHEHEHEHEHEQLPSSAIYRMTSQKKKARTTGMALSPRSFQSAGTNDPVVGARDCRKKAIGE
jgi:hypothetical protein